MDGDRAAAGKLNSSTATALDMKPMLKKADGGFGEEKERHIVSSYGELVSSLTSTIFYSASTGSLESFSDMSQHSDEGGKQEDYNWEETVKMASQSRDNFDSVIEHNKDELSVFVEPVFYSQASKSSGSEESERVKLASAPNNMARECRDRNFTSIMCREAKPHSLTFVHDKVGLGKVPLGSKTSLVQSISEKDAAINNSDVNAQSSSSHDSNSTSAQSSSPTFQSPVMRQTTLAHPPSSGTAETILPVFDWKTKRRNTSSISTVRALESAFLATKLSSQSERDLVDSLTTEKPKLKERASTSPLRRLRDSFRRVSVSPIKSWQRSVDHCIAPPGIESIQQQKMLPPCLTQVHGPSFECSGSSMLSNRCLSSGSNSTVHDLPVELVNRSVPHTCQRKFIPEPEIACNPFTSAHKSIRGFPMKQGSFLLPQSSYPSAILHGYLHKDYEDGYPMYTFLLDNSQDALIAKGCKSEDCPEKDGYVSMYTFHSGSIKAKGGWKWGKKKSVAGNMKVSSMLHPEVTSSGQITHFLELEFVLFNAHNQNVPKCLSSRFPSARFYPKSISHSEPDVSLMSPRGHPSEKAMMTRRLDDIGFQSRRQSPAKARLRHELSCSEDSCSESQQPDVEPQSFSYPSYPELAAIIITIPVGTKETEGCNLNHVDKWPFLTDEVEHLKRNKHLASDHKNATIFLPFTHGGNMSGRRVHEENSLSSIVRAYGQNKQHGNSNETILKTKFSTSISPSTTGLSERSNYDGTLSYDYRTEREGKSQKTKRNENVTVVLPAGSHGLPLQESKGPASLIERWKSGEMCDCGGWDLGCGLVILGTERPSLYSAKKFRETTTNELLAVNSSLSIFSQNSRQDIVVFSLNVVQDGSFSLNFRTSCSKLQAFAIAVAVLHSKDMLVSIGVKEKVCVPNKNPSSLPLRQPKLWPNLYRSGSKAKGDNVIFSPHYEEDVKCPAELPLSPFARV